MIRNLAIKGVDTAEKAYQVITYCEDGSGVKIEPFEEIEDQFNDRKQDWDWFFDDGTGSGFMWCNSRQTEHPNFINCTQMSWEEFERVYINGNGNYLGDIKIKPLIKG